MREDRAKGGIATFVGSATPAMRPYFLLAIVAIGLAATASAQPYRFGCHYFRNAPHHPHRPHAAGDRDGIQEVIARSDTFDILHYDIAIDITDVAGHSITAATGITYTALVADAPLRMDLIDALVVDSVTSPGGALPFTHADSILTIALAPTAIGDTGTVTVHYHGVPGYDTDWGGFRFQNGYIYNLGIGLSTIPPNFGKVRYPCFDSFVERATYAYHVKSAGTYSARCQGELLGETQLGGDTVVRHFAFDHAIPTHISAIAASNYADSSWTHTGAYGDIPIRLSAKPAALGAMVPKFASLGEAIDCYEHWYGPYPYDRVGYVLTTDGALEIAENIAYPDFMPSQSLFQNRGLFGHELGHHWWGDNVTPLVHNHMWLKEGPAEYSGHLLEEWAFGQDAFVDVVKDNMLYVLEEAHLQDGGFQALSPMPDEYIYGLHTYYKGAAVMHNLRGYLGDTLFRQAMRTVQLEQAQSTIDAYGFQSALEEATGASLGDFFNDQVFSPGFSVFTVQNMHTEPQGNDHLVELTLRQRLRGTTGMHHNVPLDITLISATGERQEYEAVADGVFTSVQFACPFDPAMAVLNGHNRLNQARMDHEFTAVPGVPFASALPYVDFRVDDIALTDSTLIRVEHIWAGAGNDPAEWGIHEVSSTHYWTVDGLWPEGTALNGRVYYHGDPGGLDEDLYGSSETDALLVYRENAETPWRLCPDVTLVLGSLTDGTGNMKIDTLRRGHYTFAKGNVVIGMEDAAAAAPLLGIAPNPANDQIRVRGRIEGAATLFFDVLDTEGRLTQRTTMAVRGTYDRALAVDGLPDGAYLLRVHDGQGGVAGTGRFSVLH